MIRRLLFALLLTLGATEALASAFSPPAMLSAAAHVPPGTFIYEWSATGSDSNNCNVGTPCQTAAKFNSFSFPNGSTILIDPSAAITGCWVAGYNTNMTGVGPYAVASANGLIPFHLQSNSTCAGVNSGTLGPKSALFKEDGVNNFTIGNGFLDANGTTTQFGLLLTNNSSVQNHNVTVAPGMEISGFHITATQDYGTELQIFGFSEDGSFSCAGTDTITILSPYLHGVSGPTSTDDNGLAMVGCGLNLLHVHITTPTVLNIGTRVGLGGLGGFGVEFANVEDGRLYDPLIGYVGANLDGCGGSSGTESTNSNNIGWEGGEIHHTSRSNGCDSDGVDPDFGTTNSHIWHLYTHDNTGPGIMTYQGNSTIGTGWGPLEVVGNISENDGIGYTGYSGGSIFLQEVGADATVYVLNNTIRNSPTGSTRTPALGFYGGFPRGLIAGNIFDVDQDPAGVAALVSCVGASNQTPASWLGWENNDYHARSGTSTWNQCGAASGTTLANWQAHVAGADLNSTTADPVFVNSGPQGACGTSPGAASPNCPAGYKLQGSSPLLAMGGPSPLLAPISSAITTDFYGGAWPGLGQLMSVGAYQYQTFGTEGTSPTVAITVPSNGATVSGNVTITATCTDAKQCQSVQFKINGVTQGPAAFALNGSASIVWPTTFLPNASYTIGAVGQNTAGRPTTASNISVTTSNTPGLAIGNTLHGVTFYSGTIFLTYNMAPISTLSSSGQMAAFVLLNSNGIPTITAASNTLGAWTKRKCQDAGNGGQNILCEFTHTFSSQLTNEVLTITVDGSSIAIGYLVVDEIEVVASTGFDSHAGLPVSSTSDPLAISTSDSGPELIIGSFRTAASGPSQGSCCTLVPGSGLNNLVSEYVSVGTPQTGLSFNIGTPGNAEAGIVDALK